MGIVFDTGEDGFRTVVKDYQEMAMRIIWGSDRPLSSRDVWIEVNKGFEGTGSISRASIINFLNAMCDEGILTYGDETGRGGYHRIYSPGLGEEGFKRHVAKTVVSKLLETWPDTTREAYRTLVDRS